MLRKLAANRAAHARNGMARIRAGIFCNERLAFRAADGLFDHRANFFVTGFFMDDSMTEQNAARVCVYDEDRMIARVEQDGVGGFRANAVEFQQLGSELCSRLGKHAVQRSRILPVKECDERLEIARFLAEVAGRPHERFKFIERQITHCADAESVGATQVDQGFLHVAPIGVLREISADDHFKA